MNPTTPPLVTRPARPRTALLVRAGLVVVAVGLAAVFAVAGWINPYGPDGAPKTMATHTQIGLAACNFLAATGRPCPSCGMTTSFALLVRGDVAASLRANWAGTVIGVLWAVALPWAIVSAARNRLIGVPRGRAELYLTVVVGVVLVLMIGRWVGVLLTWQQQ